MNLKHIIILFLLALTITACDTTIYPTLQSADPQYVVDAFIDDKLAPQSVKLMKTQPYFQEELPPPVTGAVVSIIDNDGTVFDFPENPGEPGSYVWTPAGTGFGEFGKTYTLTVQVNGETFVSQSKMGRVPVIDSITFEPDEREAAGKVFYRGQFWAKDPAGPGDTYWIRAYKNGVLLNKPSEMNLAYDAAFSKGSNFDGFEFIQPIRWGINADEQDANGDPVSPLQNGDSVYVEIHSLTEATFDFLNQVAVETNRPGGFSELFARPLANVSTNITNQNPNGTKVQGFFNVGAVSALGKRFVQ